MITVENLHKSYGKQPALNDISFTIGAGEFYGLLGPNGAGKTTTISIISTVLAPDSGNVIIDGKNLRDNSLACKSIIGVVPQEIALYEKLTAKENLFFWGSLYNIDKKTLASRIDETLKLVGLADRAEDKISSYSGGMKRRINIASSLLHRPKILFMDEPTVGIDPQSRNLIFEVVEQLHREGMTIVYTTHYMEEAERMCDRIGIIDKGRIVAQGTLQQLREHVNMKESIVVRVAAMSEEQEQKLRSRLSGNFVISENTITLEAHDLKTDLPRIISLCSETGLEPENIDIRKVNLETIFLHLTGKQLRD